MGAESSAFITGPCALLHVATYSPKTLLLNQYLCLPRISNRVLRHLQDNWIVTSIVSKGTTSALPCLLLLLRLSSSETQPHTPDCKMSQPQTHMTAKRRVKPTQTVRELPESDRQTLHHTASVCNRLALVLGVVVLVAIIYYWDQRRRMIVYRIDSEVSEPLLPLGEELDRKNAETHRTTQN